MRNKSGWVNNGTQLSPHFDFILRGGDEITKERVNEEVMRTLSSYEQKGLRESENSWQALLLDLPCNLRKIIFLEISEFNNCVIGISRDGWPDKNSVIAKLRNGFSQKSKMFSPLAIWRRLDDPHYCTEEICEVFDGTQYLLLN